MSEFDGRPLVAGVVRGVRAFGWGPEGMLVGPSYPWPWEPGENHALCVRGFDVPPYVYSPFPALYSAPLPVDHPLDGCRHGFYAFTDGSRDYWRPGLPQGVIEGYGETVIGTRGFRSMKARIVALTFEGVEHGDPWDQVVTGCACTACAVRRSLNLPREMVLPRNYRRAVLERYQGIPVFPTFQEMVAAFPPDLGLPSPPEPPPIRGARFSRVWLDEAQMSAPTWTDE